MLDFTGLDGLYDISLDYTIDEAPSDVTAPNVFTAVQDHLGGKLESGKDQFDMIIVDRVEKVPTEN